MQQEYHQYWWLCFQGTVWEKIVEADNLAAALTNDDEVNMNAKKGYGTKDTSGNLSSANPPISVAAPKPLSLNMDSRSVWSFA